MSGASITVTVSLGRNVGVHAMSEESWQRFTTEATRVVRNLSETVHFVGYGVGTYNGTEEESYTVVATSIVPSLAAMRSELGLLAMVNGQDSIAVTSGATRFVHAGS